MRSANSETVNIGNTRKLLVLELAERIKALTESHSDIVFKPLPKDDPKGDAQTQTNWENSSDGSQKSVLRKDLKERLRGFLPGRSNTIFCVAGKYVRSKIDFS